MGLKDIFGYYKLLILVVFSPAIPSNRLSDPDNLIQVLLRLRFSYQRKWLADKLLKYLRISVEEKYVRIFI